MILLGCSTEPIDENGVKPPEEPLRFLWEYQYDYFGWGPRTQPVVVSDSLIIMTGDQYITCLRTVDGTVKWKYQAPGGREAKIWNLLFDETQFYGWERNAGEVLYALDIQSGQLTWSIDSVAYSDLHGLGPAHYSPHGREAFKISLTGEVLDTVKSDQTFDSMSFYNGRVYGCFGFSDPGTPHFRGRIICYDEETMDSLWTFEEPKGGFEICYPVFDNGIMYLGTIWGEENRIIALNAENGHAIWVKRGITGIQIIKQGDRLFVESGAAVYALDVHTGNQIWQADLTNPDDNPSMSYLDGYIYIQNLSIVFVIDATTGEIVHKVYGSNGASIEEVSAGTGKIFIQSTRSLSAFTPYNSTLAKERQFSN